MTYRPVAPQGASLFDERERLDASIELLAFDLDGTLVDSAPDLDYCLGAALESIGLDAPTEDQTRSWVGDGVEELIRRAVRHGRGGEADDDEVQTALAAFSACYGRNLFVRSRLYPGVRDTLAELATRPVRLACITNKRMAFANGVLEQAGILGRFELVLGGDSLPQKKPSPAQLDAACEQLGVPASSAVLVGDSDHDLEAARAAGWRFIWASYGYRRIDPARRTGIPTLTAFADLMRVL